MILSGDEEGRRVQACAMCLALRSSWVAFAVSLFTLCIPSLGLDKVSSAWACDDRSRRPVLPSGAQELAAHGTRASRLALMDLISACRAHDAQPTRATGAREVKEQANLLVERRTRVMNRLAGHFLATSPRPASKWPGEEAALVLTTALLHYDIFSEGQQRRLLSMSRFLQPPSLPSAHITAPTAESSRAGLPRSKALVLEWLAAVCQEEFGPCATLSVVGSSVLGWWPEDDDDVRACDLDVVLDVPPPATSGLHHEGQGVPGEVAPGPAGKGEQKLPDDEMPAARDAACKLRVLRKLAGALKGAARPASAGGPRGGLARAVVGEVFVIAKARVPILRFRACICGPGQTPEAQVLQSCLCCMLAVSGCTSCDFTHTFSFSLSLSLSRVSAVSQLYLAVRHVTSHALSLSVCLSL